MYKNAELMLMRVVTPVHVGSGNELGLIDLPIQREGHTNYPKFESSSLKGAVRQALEENAAKKEDVFNIHNLFGFDSASLNYYIDPDGNVQQCGEDVEKAFNKAKKTDQFAGCMGFTDGKILLFPVPSAKGVFAYITCKAVLERFFEECVFSGISIEHEIPVLKKQNAVWYVSDDSEGQYTCTVNLDDNNIVLEEYTYRKYNQENGNDCIKRIAEIIACGKEAYYKHLIEKMVIIPDDDFRDFVSFHTEVITRTKINNITGTVEKGALFTEEYLPSQTVLYCSVLYTVSFVMFLPNGKADADNKKLLESAYTAEKVKDIFSALREKISIMQIGAGSSIGKGIIQVTYTSDKQMGGNQDEL